MPLKLSHLTRDDHEELARLLNQMQDNLTAAARIVRRAPFTDRMLNAAKHVQERLIDPLREAWDDKWGGRTNPYQSIGYAPGRR
jgi:hypothetical protein